MRTAKTRRRCEVLREATTASVQGTPTASEFSIQEKHPLFLRPGFTHHPFSCDCRVFLWFLKRLKRLNETAGTE